jgi:hypothetical protein
MMRKKIAGMVTAAAKQMRNQYRIMARTLLPSLERQVAQLEVTSRGAARHATCACERWHFAGPAVVGKRENVRLDFSASLLCQRLLAHYVILRGRPVACSLHICVDGRNQGWQQITGSQQSVRGLDVRKNSMVGMNLSRIARLLPPRSQLSSLPFSLWPAFRTEHDSSFDKLRTGSARFTTAHEHESSSFRRWTLGDEMKAKRSFPRHPVKGRET